MSRLYRAWTALVSGAMSMVAPAAAGRWRIAREMYRGYLSGTASGPDQNYRPRLRSADADVRAAEKLTSARCRDQYQNNPLIAGAIERICTNVVRDGIMPRFLFRARDGRLDSTANRAWSQLFARWSLYCDSTGHDSYGELQTLALRHQWFDGRCLVRRLYDDSLPGIVPLRLEMIEAQQLDSRVDGQLANGNFARRGCEMDRHGRPVRYHIFDGHPGDTSAATLKTITVPASDIIDVWDREMISQHGGIAWLHAVVMEGYRMDEFRHLTQDNARAQAIYAFFLKNNVPGFQLGGGIPAGGMSAPYAGASTTDASALTLNSTTIQPLPNGMEVQTVAPSHPGNNYADFVRDSQRMQSVGAGISFEAYANNYTDASYASARSGSLEERLSYQGQQQFLEMKLNRRLIGWFIEAAWLAGLAPVTLPGYARDPLLFQEMACGRLPGWTWVDPRNDADASKTLISEVLDTRTNQSAGRGLVWEDIVEMQIDEERKLQELYQLRSANAKLMEPSHAPTPSA